MSLAVNKQDGNLFKLTSKNIINGQKLPENQVLNAYGCSGKNVSPQLSWENAPQNTKSYAIICHDPDAPRQNGWYHWLVVNIPNDVTSIEEAGKINGALETITDFNKSGYGGACPPVGHGIHHYNFTVYALDTEKLNVKENSVPLEVENEINKHKIAASTLTAIYERK